MILGHVQFIKAVAAGAVLCDASEKRWPFEIKLFNTYFVNSKRNLTEIVRQIQYIIS